MSGFGRQIIISGISILCLWAVVAQCAQLPTDDDIAQQAASARKVFGEFMRDSLALRLRYQYTNRFLNTEDSTALVAFAQKAHTELGDIYESQSAIKERIEDYEGFDWDSLYGQTGLWRRLYSDLQKTAVMQCRTDLYGAVGSGQTRRKEILERIIAKCDSPKSDFGSANAALLKARAFEIMSRTDDDYRRRAREVLDSHGGPDDVGEHAFYEARLLDMQLAEVTTPVQFYALATALGASGSSDDFELNVSLALLEIKLRMPGDTKLLKAVTDEWPGLKSVLGEFVLDQLSQLSIAGRLNAESLEEISPLEITMALSAIASGDAARYGTLVEKISSIKKFQTPLAMYVHAEAITATDPSAAIKYYIKAAMAIDRGGDDDLALSPADIASRAARVAYSLYYKDANYLDTARLTLEYYSRAAGDDIDEQLEYLYAEVLSRSDKTNTARQLLEKISSSQGRFSQEAKVDLMAHRIRESAGDPFAKVQIAKQLERMIDATATQAPDSRAHVKAVELFCRLLLEDGDPASAERVLDMLDKLGIAEAGDFTLVGATALYKLNRHAEAIQLLAGNVDEMTCAAAGGVYAMLAEVLQQLDLYESPAGATALPVQFTKLTEFCTNCVDRQLRGHVELVWVEFTLLTAGGDKDALAAAETVLGRLKDQGFAGHTDWARCKARLLMEQSRYAEAFELWAQVRATEKFDPDTDIKSISWWRAKYYELFCFLNASDANAEKVTHAIEILHATHDRIPAPWAAKFQALKNTESSE